MSTAWIIVETTTRVGALLAAATCVGVLLAQPINTLLGGRND